MEEHWAKIIEAVGEDLQRPGLAETPGRAARAFEFLTRGYHQSVDEVVNEALCDKTVERRRERCVRQRFPRLLQAHALQIAQ